MSAERKAKILIGSSSEGLEVARAFKAALEPEMRASLWCDDFFTAGEYTLETLEARSRSFDGALVVGTSDDQLISRGMNYSAMRDNLLLEFGMFVAMFGRRRALLAIEGLGETKVASDLFGLTCIGFSRTEQVDEGIASAVVQIKRVVNGFALGTVDSQVALRLEQVLRAFIGDLQQALGSPTQIGFHVWVVDERLEPPKLVRVARSRTSPKAPLGKEFAEGEGVTGECWRTAAAVYVDFNEEPYRSVAEGSWAEFGAGVRKGMSFDLLGSSRERYRAIGATPVISELATGNRVLGCLSYNVGPNVDALTLNADLHEIEKVLDRVAEVVRIVLNSG